MGVCPVAASRRPPPVCGRTPPANPRGLRERGRTRVSGRPVSARSPVARRLAPPGLFRVRSGGAPPEFPSARTSSIKLRVPVMSMNPTPLRSTITSGLPYIRDPAIPMALSSFGTVARSISPWTFTTDTPGPLAARPLIAVTQMEAFLLPSLTLYETSSITDLLLLRGSVASSDPYGRRLSPRNPPCLR